MATGDRIAMALASDIAPLFDTSATYLVGSYVIHGNRLYRCTTDHYGAWDASHFIAVNVGDDLKAVRLARYPFIIEQPEDSETPIDLAAIFQVESLTATSYQWQEKSPDGNWVNSTDSGATTGNLMVPITAQNVRGYKWRCRLKNANGKTVFTNAVTNNPKYDFAPAFDSTESYAVGAYTIYSGILYRCTTAHTGNWDASHFEAVSVGDELNNRMIEDVDNPGCFYRWVSVGGTPEKEWWNPPMVANTRYRTTERYRGKPVYVYLMQIDKFTAATEKTYMLDGTGTDPYDTAQDLGVYIPMSCSIQLQKSTTVTPGGYYCTSVTPNLTKLEFYSYRLDVKTSGALSGGTDGTTYVLLKFSRNVSTDRGPDENER